MAPGAQALATPYSLVPGAAPTGAQGQEQGQAPDDGVSPGPTHLPWEERQAQGQAHVRAGVARRLDGPLGLPFRPTARRPAGCLLGRKPSTGHARITH